jgi:hypothetical protein
MPDAQGAAKSPNPVDQVTQGMKTVSEALKAAGEKAVQGHQEIAQCAMRQAEENAAQLMETLKTMGSNQNPSEVGAAYTRFVTEAAQKNAKQLLEIGQLMARTSQETWGPVVQAMMSAAKTTGS